MKINNYFILITLFCIILGFILRTYHLSEIPTGFFADEASIGVNAYSIFSKGTDEYGTPFPLFFRAFGEYKSPIQIYTTIPFIAIFGLNEFGTRLPSALFGTSTILALFFLTKELFKYHKNKNNIALFAAFLLTISPWHIHFSRIAFELMPFVLFTVLGLYFFLKAQENTRFFFLSAFLFIIAMYSYFPARIFIPLFGLSLAIIYYRYLLKHKKQVFFSCIFFIFLLVPMIIHTLSPYGFARMNQVSVFSQPLHDMSIVQHITLNYISHFSFDFLFLKGDIDMPGQFITRHSVRGMGELYFFQLPLLFLGLIYLVKRKNYHTFFLLLAWLVIYPIGSMFTTDTSAQATRSIIGVIPFQILSALGLYYLFVILNNRTEQREEDHLLDKGKAKNLNQHFRLGSSIIFTIIILSSFIYYLNLYFVTYPTYASDFWGWQYGAKDIVTYFASQEKNYDELIMAPEFNAPNIFFTFYAPDNCTKCKVGLPHEMYNPIKKQLFAVTPTYIAQKNIKFNTIKTLYYPNNTVAFQIGDIVQ